jgi:hypothetical protein
MKKFLNQRKKDNRKSLMIDNINVEQLHDLIKRRNSLNNMNKVTPMSMDDEERVYSNLGCENMKQFITPYESTFQENTFKENNCSSTINSYESETMLSQNNRDGHICNLCYNQNATKDTFMILNCQHIFHIKCLVDNHYLDANKFGVIDEEYLNSRKCTVCNKQMEMEDILHIHNKFYKNTKEYITKQDEIIKQLDKQMSKIKDELRTCYEYKQRLEHQREKSRQITVTINTLM